LRQFQASGGDYSRINENAPAECLYLIVSANPEALAQFHDNEIGDTDQDGLPEFIDGWGRPIYFLRWAPRFEDSDLQKSAPAAAQDDHDPFDSRRVDPNAWRLVPLIFSAGPDGEYGIAIDTSGSAYTWNNDTYAQAFGAPTGSTHYDNLHNHRIEAK
jgi:hypothetical protein